MWKLSIKLCLLGVLLCTGVGSARADIMKMGRFTVERGSEAGQYEFLGQVATDGVPEGEIEWPENCAPVGGDRQFFSGMLTLDYTLQCDGALADREMRLPWGQDGGVLTARLGGEPVTTMLRGDSRGLTLQFGAESPQNRSFWAIAAEYTMIGITHILIGWDHLAFVTCLCLLARGATLLYLMTAFTLGHSLSLALSYFGVVSIPVPPTEAVIALSIAFMANEAIMAWRTKRNVHDARWRYMAIVAAFGLLHGLGFASVLGEIGVSAGEQVAGLIFFNIGVEIGQLLFIAGVSTIGLLASYARVQTPLRYATVYLVGAMGAFWTIERITGIVLSA